VTGLASGFVLAWPRLQEPYQSIVSGREIVLAGAPAVHGPARGLVSVRRIRSAP